MFFKLITILGLFSLVELLRVLCSHCTYFVPMKTSIKMTILAGRYLAAVCKADINNHERGVKEFELMQTTYERLYPNTYNITVYRKTMGAKPEKVFEGNKNNRVIIPIIWFFYNDKSDFFGLRHPLPTSDDEHVSNDNIWKNSHIFEKD